MTVTVRQRAVRRRHRRDAAQEGGGRHTRQAADDRGRLWRASSDHSRAAQSLEPSYVLKALGVSTEQARGSLRFTFGHCNTKQDIDYLMKYLPLIIAQQRAISR